MNNSKNKLTKKEAINKSEKFAYDNEEIIDAKRKVTNNGVKYWFVKVKCKECGEEHEERMCNFITYRKQNKRKCKCQKNKKVNKNQIELLTETKEGNCKMNNVVVLSGKLADVQYLNNDMIKFNLDSGQGIFECMRIFNTEKEYEEFKENYNENMNISVLGYPKRNTIFPMYVVCKKPLKYNGKYSIINNIENINKLNKNLKDKEKQLKEIEGNYRDVLKEKSEILLKCENLQKENENFLNEIKKLKQQVEDYNKEENITLKEIKEALSMKKAVEKMNKRFEQEREKTIEEKFIEDKNNQILNDCIKQYGTKVKLQNTRLGERIYYRGEKLYAYDLFELAKKNGKVSGNCKFKRNVLVFEKNNKKYKIYDYEEVYKNMEVNSIQRKTGKICSWLSKGHYKEYKVYIEKIN